MDTLDPIFAGRDWQYIHTVSISGGGSLSACHTIEMMWKYGSTDPDADAAAKLTWKMAGGGGAFVMDQSDLSAGITVIDDTHFQAWIPAALTQLISPGSLYVGVAYLLLDGRVIREENLSPPTKCFPGIPLVVDP